MPNTIDFFQSLSCLITNDQLMLLGSHYHRFLWHHIFLPFFQSFYLLFLLRLKRFQTLLLWFESPPESILCPYFQLHIFKSHSAYLLQDTWFPPPDFKSSLLLYNYIAKLPFFSLWSALTILYVKFSRDLNVRKISTFYWENSGKINFLIHISFFVALNFSSYYYHYFSVSHLL